MALLIFWIYQEVKAQLLWEYQAVFGPKRERLAVVPVQTVASAGIVVRVGTKIFAPATEDVESVSALTLDERLARTERVLSGLAKIHQIAIDQGNLEDMARIGAEVKFQIDERLRLRAEIEERDTVLVEVNEGALVRLPRGVPSSGSSMAQMAFGPMALSA